MFRERTTEEIIQMIEEANHEMNMSDDNCEQKIEDKIKELLGEKLGSLFIKIAKQLEKVDRLEKENSKEQNFSSVMLKQKLINYLYGLEKYEINDIILIAILFNKECRY